MALFGSKKNDTKKTEKKSADAAKAETVSQGKRDLTHILSQARITEKASMHQSDNQVYTFNIASSATKRDIIRAVHDIYKVTPRMVRVVTIPKKTVRHMKTGKMGMKGGGKKAYVYLKSGDSITIS